MGRPKGFLFMRKIIFYKRLIIYFVVVAVVGLLLGGSYSAGYNQGRRTEPVNVVEGNLSGQMVSWVKNNLGDPPIFAVNKICVAFNPGYEVSGFSKKEGKNVKIAAGEPVCTPVADILKK